jgi:hypothetical protein
MSTTLTPNAQIILSALSVTGAKPQAPVKSDYVDNAEGFAVANAAYDAATVAYDQNLKANARDIKVMLGDKSRIGAQLAALDLAMDADNPGGKVFVGTVLGVTKEKSSTRAIVTLHTGTDRTSDNAPAGAETVRTDRTDNPDGRAIARAAQLLVGHRVTVYIELEQIRGGSTKVRVVRHFEDNGIDPKYDAATGTVSA